MAWLPDGEKISKISLFVLTQLTNVTDTQRHTDGQTPHDSIGRAMHRIARQKRCTSIVQRKLTNVDCSDNWGNIYVHRPGRAGPVFSLDRRRPRLFRNYSAPRYTAIYSLRNTIYGSPYSRHFVKTNHVHSVNDNFA